MLTAQGQTCCHAHFCIFTGTKGNVKQLLERMGQPEHRVALRLVWAAWLTTHWCSRENPMACLAFSKWQLSYIPQSSKEISFPVSGLVLHITNHSF